MSISVGQAADRLGISPQRVRALLRARRLAGHRLGREWLVDESAVNRFAGSDHSAGRPLSTRSAWAVLDLLSGIEPAGLSRSERRRAGERAAAAASMAPLDLAARATIHPLRGHPGILARFGEDPRLVLGGVSAAGHVGADIVAPGLVEAYVRAEDWRTLVAEYLLRPPPDGVAANVILRIPPRAWPFSAGVRVAPSAVVAADLVDAGDDRSLRAGRALLAEAAAS